MGMGLDLWVGGGIEHLTVLIKMVTILAHGVHDVLAILLIMKIDHNDNDKDGDDTCGWWA